MKKYVLVETPMFGTRKKIRAVSESVVALELSNEVSWIELPSTNFARASQ